MNFLQICQRACVECGVASGLAIQTALPTVVGATGSLGRVVGWVNDGWTDIQMDHDDWDWLRSSSLLGAGVSFQTVAGQASYPLDSGAGAGNSLVVPGTPPLLGGLWNDGEALALAPGVDMVSLPTALPALGGLWNNGGVLCFAPGPDGFSSPTGMVGVAVDNFGKWDRETFRCYPTAVGFQAEQFLDEVPFDAWRNAYMLGAQRTVQTRPVVMAVGPDQSICLGPPPDGTYTITGDYFVAPTEMAADTDIPVGLPTRFHMLIVYRTMMKYAGFESAPEVYQRGSEENAGMYAQLMAVRAQRMSFGGALA